MARERKRTFLARLAGDTTGNVIAMGAAALIPLLAMVGGGIDASRVYMTYTRLQQACDSGALAGRKAMNVVTTLTTAEQNKAKEFFDFNFPENTNTATNKFSPKNIVRNFTKGADGVVNGTASADLPTTIMRAFGYDTVPLSVTCQSTLNIPNTDVMFVLDVTGSMKEIPTGDSVMKIDGLKAAVKDFYSALGPGAAAGPGRIRYGFVPYSSNVNVGKIVYAANPAYIAGGGGSEPASYQSRSAETTTEHVASYGSESAQNQTSSSSTTTVYGNYINDQVFYNLTLAECTAKVQSKPDTDTVSSSNTTLNSDENPPTYPDNTRDRTYTTTEQHQVVDNGASWGQTSGSGTSAKGTCQTRHRNGTYTKTIQSNTTTPTTWTERIKFLSWKYGPRSIDVSPLVQNSSAANPAYYSGYWTGTDPNLNGGEDAGGTYYTTTTMSTLSWNGCIEEASTNNSINASSSLSIPSDANDLQIDLKPSSPAERWKPYLPGLQYAADGDWLNRDSGWISRGYAACPREASRLTMYASDYVTASKSSPSFNTYVDSLNAIGGTYHDIGLIWGARFLSPDGIFAADNRDSAAPGAYQVSRHIVFMTDGTLDTKPAANDPWGINRLDGRIAPASSSETDLEAVHEQRTKMICNAMKGKGYIIWVIGFGISDLTQTLKDCASDDAHWSVATNSATLRSKFSQIAQTIGGLRLSQ